ncbi:MAG: hypothetical protein E6G64_10130 [Actinobacteria bacterium]|nr:MAG: hypothetical protein E6G64_10130 [Actinomycetota bacterium]
MVPSRAVPRKFVFNSTVVNPVPPSGSDAKHVLDQHDVDAQQPGQRARGHRLKIRGVYFRWWDETYFATLTI